MMIDGSKKNDEFIDAGFSELRDAFNCHSRNPGETPSHYLLLFYAVECGLKATYLSRKTGTKGKISEEKKLRTHALDFLVKELGISGEFILTDTDFHLEDKSPKKVARLQEAWRYGNKIQPDDQQRLVEWLRSIHAWIRENNYQ